MKLESNNQTLNQNEIKDRSTSKERTKFLGSKTVNNSKSTTSSLKSKQELSLEKKVKTRKPLLRKKSLNIPGNSSYRIIIKILQTNPSAPAENVTSLLRDAGVIFEVEKIERLERNAFRNNFSSGK